MQGFTSKSETKHASFKVHDRKHTQSGVGVAKYCKVLLRS
jgi:hypothetical protein